MKKSSASLYIGSEHVGDIELTFFDMFHVGGNIKYLPAYDRYKTKIEAYINFRKNLEEKEDEMAPQKIDEAYEKLEILSSDISGLGLYVKQSGKDIEVDPVCLDDDGYINYRV
ncbi:MAG: hypothetical protein ACI808_003088 [Paraglaciecola sp.]|jgi:hypothetical protein